MQASEDEMEQAKLANACWAICRAESAVQSAVQSAHRDLHGQILRSQDAGLGPDSIANAVSGRLDADAVQRMLDAYALVKRVRSRLTGLGEGRAHAVISDFEAGKVCVVLNGSEAEGDWADDMFMSQGYVDVKDSEEAAAFHAAALRDAQVLLHALAPRYDVLAPGGEPTTSAFLAPEPLAYISAVIHDRMPSPFGGARSPSSESAP
ncbi:hypothetical protein [Streptomyces sp. V1I1]|uniref:hypothetical protein n=1 Tax=Streptomyces sp. V1I1 TaxID=3042272 RepID=UPI00278A2FEE|nr:hypothetical protein [Streptomyces sp. V1I1]MDQ0945978.1 hypothetical protein [Streptomyces sp. V1I1]